MKKPKILLFALSLAILFSSCQSVYFTETQPRGNPYLSQVPQKLQGNYLVMEGAIGDEEAFYHVHKHGFIMYQESNYSLSMDSLESAGVYIKDSLLYIKEITEPEEANGFPYTIKDDTLHTTYYRWDEQKLNDEVKLTEDRGKYYLNMFDDSKSAWECIQIDILRNEDLLIWNIESKKEKVGLTTILGANKIKPDSDDWIASPSKRKFRKFLKSGGFQELTHFLHKLDKEDLPELMANKIKSGN